MICYGIDIGTTTIRMIVTEVSFDVLGARKVSVLSKTPLCHFTPFAQPGSLNIPEILRLIKTYTNSQKLPKPETGTVLYTGEAQRSDNLTECTAGLSTLWPDLFSAQLSPEVESRLAAFGAGAVEYSKHHPGKTLIHLDIGGGTTNLARIENGEIVDTACLDLGCRKWILDPNTLQVLHRHPIASYLEEMAFKIQSPLNQLNLESAQILSTSIASLLLNYCIASPPLNSPYVIIPWKLSLPPKEQIVFSLSGGIADCSEFRVTNPFVFGDLGPLLLNSIETKMAAEKHEWMMAPQTGRATVLGISAYSFQLAGSSIYHSPNFLFPQLGVLLIDDSKFKQVPCKSEANTLAVYMDKFVEPSLTKLETLVKEVGAKLSQRKGQRPVTLVFVFEKNIAQSFGFLLQKQLGATDLNFCVIDEISLAPNPIGIQYLDLSKDPATNRILVRIRQFARF